MKREEKTIAKNKKAFHEYEILETLEAGNELAGTGGRPVGENHWRAPGGLATLRGRCL